VFVGAFSVVLLYSGISTYQTSKRQGYIELNVYTNRFINKTHLGMKTAFFYDVYPVYRESLVEKGFTV